MSFRPDSSTLLRSLRRGWVNLRRGRTVTGAACAMVGVLFFAQIFAVIGWGLDSMRPAVLSNHPLSIQIRAGAMDRDIQELIVAVRQLPGVASLEYVPREKALERERLTNPDAVAFLEQSITGNPYRDTVSVTLARISAFDTLRAFGMEPRRAATIDPLFLSQVDRQYAVLAAQMQILETGRALAFIALAVTIVTLLLLVADSSRRTALLRRGDLFVERMAGADELSLVIPFAVEAIVVLFVAFCVSLGAVALLLFGAQALFPQLAEPFVGVWTAFLFAYGPVAALVGCMALAIVGFLGAVMGIRRVHFSPHGPFAIN